MPGETKTKPQHLFKAFWATYKSFFFQEKRKTIALLILVATGVLISSVSPFLYGRVIDGITSADLASVGFFIVLHVFVTVVTSLVRVAETRTGSILSLTLSNKVKERIFRIIVYMRCPDKDRFQNGELLNRLESCGAGIISYFIDVVTSILMIVTNLCISLFFIFSISPRLSILAICLMPFSYLIGHFYKKKVKEIQRKNAKYQDRYMANVYETLDSSVGIKSFLLESLTRQKYRKLIDEGVDIQKESLTVNAFVSTLQDVFGSIVSAIILYVSSVFIVGGAMTIGSLVSFNVYLDKLVNAVQTVMNLNLSSHENAVNIERLNEIESLLTEDVTEPQKQSLTETISEISFRDVDFSYIPSNRVLKNFSFDIKGPGWYSLVGENGCGKSSVLRVLMKYYPFESGTVSVNSIDIDDLNAFSLRSQIAYVSKEHFLLNDTIYNNLTLFDNSRPIDCVVDVCRKVGIHLFINNLQKKYETVIGNGGMTLSSGQTQKLMLARALLQNCSVVLLDEITSDLDGAAEKEIVEVIRQLSKTKIVISIAHRASMISAADYIHLVEDGRVSACGTSDALLLENSKVQKFMAATRTSRV